jgi:hypothetical protein
MNSGMAGCFEPEHNPFERPRLSAFFPLENAWWRLRQAG